MDISKMLDIPESTIKSNYYLTIRKIRKERNGGEIMKIDYPSEEEIRIQADIIVNSSIKKPKEGFYNTIKQIYKVIGLKNIFFGSGDITFICLAISVLIYIRVIYGRSDYLVVCMSFAFSPMFIC